MINTKELEKRWFKYKFKSYLLHLIIFIGFVIVILIASIISNIETNFIDKISSQEKVEKIQKIQKSLPITTSPELNNTQITPTLEKSNTPPKKEIKELKEEKIVVKEKIVVAPSFSFVDQIASELTTTIQPETPPKKVIQKEPIQREKQRELHHKKERALKIVRQTTHSEIQGVIKRFEKNNNPALSLFIARQYYQIDEYKKAYNYALITNGINNDIEESWIIFAKSLVKLKEKKLAIKMLKKYIKYSNSYRANILLDDINSGKFR